MGRRHRSGSPLQTVILILALAVLGVLLVLRWKAAGNGPVPAADGAVRAEHVPAEFPEAGKAAGEAGTEPAQAAAARPEEAPAASGQTAEPGQPEQTGETGNIQAPAIGRTGSRTYGEESYVLVSDMVYTYRHQQEAGMESIRRDLELLKETDPGLAAMWEKIMSFWSEVNTGLQVSVAGLPENLPRDNSLCVTVLGYQLEFDGSMAPELLGRCETALRVLEQYPQAYVAVTGGGTAAGNRDATEADVMADWFEMQGITTDRIIVESRSMTTVDNALNTCRLLTESYPEVKTMVIVTSDYHVRLGTLLFQTASYLHEYRTSSLPYTVTANAAYATSGNELFESVTMQAQDLWSLTAPTIG